MKLISTAQWGPERVAALKEIKPDLDYVCAGTAITSRRITDEDWQRDLHPFLEEVSNADIVIGSFGSTVERLTSTIEARLKINGGGGIFEQMFRVAGGRLKWVHCGSAGVDKIMFREFLASSAVLTCGKGEPVGSLLAESIMARVLFHTRGLLPAVESRSWQGGLTQQRDELRGKTMGIIGFGGTGEPLARMAAAFGMDVIATKRSPVPPPPGVRAIWGPERLHDLLRESDVVALAAPSTPETRGMIGLPEFQVMKRTAVLVNVARGDLIQGDALVTALKENLIAFAALDVLPWPEPWGPDMPLWHMKNALITPHTAGGSPGRGERSWELIRENFERFVRGEPLLSQVDKALGY
jgi:phosphoglycerate dehydrogenase-like enzyme